jgi:hypothetical protein
MSLYLSPDSNPTLGQQAGEIVMLQDPATGYPCWYDTSGVKHFFPFQPTAYGYCSNPGTVVNSTTSGNVVDSRAIAAGALSVDTILRGEMLAYVQGTNGAKNLQLNFSADTSNALAVALTAAQVGIVRLQADFLIAHTGNVHLLHSRADFNSMYGFALKRGTVSVNLGTTGGNLQAEAWVANAADSITIDTVSWRQLGGGL